MPGLEKLACTNRPRIIVVVRSRNVPQAVDRKVFIDDYLDLQTVDVVDWSPVLQLRPKGTRSVDEVYRALRGKHPSLAVYRREDVPKQLHYSGHSRIAPIVAIAADGWQITSRQRFSATAGAALPEATTATIRACSRCTDCSWPPVPRSDRAWSCRRSRTCTCTN